MTGQTWVAFVSALVFVALAAVMVMMPAPFVTWNPGHTQDTLGSSGAEPIIMIDGIKTYPTAGELDLTTVSVTRADSRLTLPEALFAYWLPKRDALPRDSIYAPGKSAEQVESEEAESMETSQGDAIVAALRAADQPVTEMPVISTVTVGGPAQGQLKPADLVVSVNGAAVAKSDQVGELIRTRKIGDKIDFVVLRDRQKTEVSVITVASTREPGVPVVGVTVGTGYQYAPRISFDLGQRIGGPSAGLVFSMAIYDKITDGALLGGLHVAGTGTITAGGEVGPIGGIQEKIAGAEKAGATVFLVPAANCKDVSNLRSDMTLVKVGTLTEGISALETLGSPDAATRTPHC